MIIAHSTIQTKARPEDIWSFYEDLDSWSAWDKDVIYANLNGEFTQGSTGKIKSKGGPEVSFTITELTKNKSFTNISYLPLTKLIFRHEIEVNNGNTLITHHVEMKGLLSPLFAFIVGRKIKISLDTTLQNLVNLAESKY